MSFLTLRAAGVGCADRAAGVDGLIINESDNPYEVSMGRKMDWWLRNIASPGDTIETMQDTIKEKGYLYRQWDIAGKSVGVTFTGTPVGKIFAPHGFKLRPKLMSPPDLSLPKNKDWVAFLQVVFSLIGVRPLEAKVGVPKPDQTEGLLVWPPKFKDYIETAQAKFSLPPTGTLDQALWDKLQSSPVKAHEPEAAVWPWLVGAAALGGGGYLLWRLFGGKKKKRLRGR